MEPVSREEHLAAIARLDAADIQLRSQIIELERTLRQDYEEKIATAVKSISSNIDRRFDRVDATLDEQNKILFKKRFQLGDLSGVMIITLVLASVISGLILHYYYHLG